MPYIHTQAFTVRHYECDAYERLHLPNYLRYMQEAAFGASAAVGYTPQRYREIGYWWLAYETDIAYDAHLRYGDTVQIRTWVLDFRRVRSLRNYEFYRDGVQIAHATTDWVLMDAATGRPATVPQDMIDAYSQGEAVEMAPPRRPQLPQSPPAPNAYTMTHTIQWTEIDPAFHVNNAVYLNYVSDCGYAALAHYGWPITRLHDAGYELVVRRQQIEYKQALVFGEAIEVVTWFSEGASSDYIQHFLIRREGKLVARVRQQVACIRLGSDEQATLPNELRNYLLHEK